MKCPLMTAGRMTCDDPLDFTYVDCLKEECAWWVKPSESCAIVAIPRIVGFLGSELKTIKDKMPTPPL